MSFWDILWKQSVCNSSERCPSRSFDGCVQFVLGVPRVPFVPLSLLIFHIFISFSSSPLSECLSAGSAYGGYARVSQKGQKGQEGHPLQTASTLVEALFRFFLPVPSCVPFAPRNVSFAPSLWVSRLGRLVFHISSISIYIYYFYIYKVYIK